LEALRESTASLAESVEKAMMVGITEYFEVWHIGGGEITEARVKEMIACAVATAITKNTDELMRRFDNKLDSLGDAFGQASGNSGGRQPRRATTPAFELRIRGPFIFL
jgi:hypothetical protein